MKRTIILSIFTFLCFSLNAQSTWVNYDFYIEPELVKEAAEQFKEFFESETGKALPTAILTDHTMGDLDYSHSMSFISDDVDQLGKLFDPMNSRNEDFQKLSIWFSENAEMIGSQTGMMIAGTEQIPSNTFQTIYSIDVVDPMATKKAFSTLLKDSKKLLKEYNVELSLHRGLSGQDNGVNYYILASFKDYSAMVKAIKAMFSSNGFVTYSKATMNNVTVEVDSRSIMAVFNAPK
jgi:hypothetical protein